MNIFRMNKDDLPKVTFRELLIVIFPLRLAALPLAVVIVIYPKPCVPREGKTILLGHAFTVTLCVYVSAS